MIEGINSKPVVIDTNVLISSALSPNGTPAKIVRYFVTHGQLVFSEETYEEFYSRLWRPKFDRYISREMRKSILLDFSNIADWVEIKSMKNKMNLSRDKDDNKFLDVAIIANALMIVSGDSDLTDLKQVEGINILTPAQCLAVIKNHV